MKVNLIKDSTVGKEVYTEVFEILTSVSGPIQFSCDNDSLVDLNNYEYLNLEDDETNKFELKKKKVVYPDMMDAIIAAHGLLKEDAKKIRLDVEIDLPCPFCQENVFMVNFPLGNYPHGYCKKKSNTIINKFSIKQYIEIEHKFTWEEFLNKTQKIIESNKYKEEIRELELKESEKTKRVTNWETLFNKCDDYRKNNNIEKEDFVILLTEISNSNNWFSSIDEKLPQNGFIHTKDWDYYINCNPAFPIAYEVIALFLQKQFFANYHDIDKYTHGSPIGCINDMCTHKREIILKLRTADICSDCMNILKQKLPFTIIHHALGILESLRRKMLFSQNFMQTSPLSRLVINKNRDIHLPDFENIQIKLNPLEKTLFMLYLFHPEGIEISSLCDYKNEMYQIYSHLSNRGDINEMKSNIDQMADITSNSASEKISKIKSKFINVIGSELALNYYIKGANAEVKKIDIDRKLIEIAD
jgi:hypothetical protein